MVTVAQSTAVATGELKPSPLTGWAAAQDRFTIPCFHKLFLCKSMHSTDQFNSYGHTLELMIRGKYTTEANIPTRQIISTSGNELTTVLTQRFVYVQRIC